MKRLSIGAAIFFAFLFVVWVIGRIAGFWGWYKIPSPANEPGIMAGDKIFVTNFIKPECNRFVVYKSRVTDSMSMQPGSEEDLSGQNYVHRLCALPNDVIEMRKGVLYINGKSFDEGLDLKQEFLLPQEKIRLLDQEDFSEGNAGIHPYYEGSADTIVISMERKRRIKYKQRFDLIPYYITDTTRPVFTWYKDNRTWTVDNFGPVQIPPDSGFVIGDNRHNSLDSRYTGFVAMKDISGVVINK